MKIINQTKDKVLAEEVFVADTVGKRIKGLLGRKEFSYPEALILKPANSIHTFFMRFPIDVLFVDKSNKVIKKICCFRPFRISLVYFQSRLVIELPAGVVQASFTSEGDFLKFIY